VTVLVLHRVKITLRLRNYCNDGITSVVGNLRVPTGHTRDILLQARRSPGLSPLRSDGSRDDQAGEAGPVEHKIPFLFIVSSTPIKSRHYFCNWGR
jgi:hypothetical protein